MTTASPEQAPPEGPDLRPQSDGASSRTVQLDKGTRFGLAALALVVTGTATWLSSSWLAEPGSSRLLATAVAAVCVGAGIWSVYWTVDAAVDLLPAGLARTLRPWAYAGPALVLVLLFLIYPVLATIWLSLHDATGEAFVGLDNYRFIATDESMRRAVLNTAAWIVVVPTVSVGIGLGFATLTNRLRHGEAVAKSIVFMPMAVSFVGAAVIWNLIYEFRPEGFGEQVGLLNGIVTAAGGAPISWKQIAPWNNLLLMAILVWIQTGFATVILSAAIKSVPVEQLEAARLDGASELQVFRSIIIPSIRGPLAVVGVSILIAVLKIFDVVYVMTRGRDGTEIVAERMIAWFFQFRDDGRGAAIAVVLFLAVIPVMIADIRRSRRAEAG
jgi:alpha-glucoside transport system permease protein